MATSEASARVGRGLLDHALEHLGGGDHHLARAVGHLDDALLQRGHLLGGELHAQVAARHHHAVGRPPGSAAGRRWPRASRSWRSRACVPPSDADQRLALLARRRPGARTRAPRSRRRWRTPKARSRRSFSVSAGVESLTPGRFMPLLGLSRPPCTTVALHLLAAARPRRAAPGCRRRAGSVARADVARQRVVGGGDQAAAVPSIVSSVVMATRCAVAAARPAARPPACPCGSWAPRGPAAAPPGGPGAPRSRARPRSPPGAPRARRGRS